MQKMTDMTSFYKNQWLICCFLISMLTALSCTNTKNRTLNKPVQHIYVQSVEFSSPVVNKIEQVFVERLEDRGIKRVSKSNASEITVVLAINNDIGKEGFTIEDGKNGSIIITGNDERGLLYGIGKFLRTAGYTDEGFTVGTWRGKSVPDKELRGIYWATHFYNYYQTAPIAELQKYVEDLGLWGYNNIKIWYDMHHFKSYDDPVAVRFRERIAHILQAAKNIGMDVSFTLVANEAYAESPKHLRALPGRERGAVYPEDICPHKPGGLEYILKVREAFFDWCKPFNPSYITIWPYDPGGCATSDCQPWGSNGFIKASEAVAQLASKIIPQTKVILSTWMMDSTEWKNVMQQMPAAGSWVNTIMAEKINDTYKGFFTKVPGNIPAIGFPEISMDGMFPWGGFGANPTPEKLAEQWSKVSNFSAGGFPYSEGIFEDINKAVYAQLYWNDKVGVDDILKEYTRYELGIAHTDSILKVIHTLEQNHHMRWWPGKLEGVKLQLDWFPSKNVKPQPDPGAEDAYEIVKKSNETMSVWAKSSWRWRILFIRTMLDAELKANGGSPNEKCYEGFYELLKLYHCTEQTDPVVKPPLPAAGNK